MTSSRDRPSLSPSFAKISTHFDASDHLVDDPNVIEIKGTLLRRIVEIDAAMQRTAELAATAALEQPSNQPTDNKES